MSLTTHVGLLAGVSVLTLTGASFGDTSAEIETLQARVAELESQLKGDDWLTEQRSEEIRGLVQDVLADADTRASLLQSNMTAGYDDGFFIGSADGNFSLKINGQVQFRWMYNYQDDNVSSSDRNRSGFEIPRARLVFTGNMVSPAWTYEVDILTDYGFVEDDFSSVNNGGGLFLNRAWVHYDMGNGWGFRGGQYKQYFQREQEIRSWNQQAVDRSLTSYIWGAGITQGLEVDYSADSWRMFIGFSDGPNTGNTPAMQYDTEYSFYGRADFLFAGMWEQFEDMQAWQGEETAFMAGVGLMYFSDEFGTTAPPAAFDNERQVFAITADGQLEMNGFNVFGSFMYGDIQNKNADNQNAFGFTVQGGYQLNENWDLFVRYEYTDFDLDNVEKLSILQGGFNYYFSQNKVKWTTDLGYSFNAIPSEAFGRFDGTASGGADYTGWRADGSDENGQIVFRTQMQLLF